MAWRPKTPLTMSISTARMSPTHPLRSVKMRWSAEHFITLYTNCVLWSKPLMVMMVLSSVSFSVQLIKAHKHIFILVLNLPNKKINTIYTWLFRKLTIVPICSRYQSRLCLNANLHWIPASETWWKLLHSRLHSCPKKTTFNGILGQARLLFM